MGYFIDSMFRNGSSTAGTAAAAAGSTSAAPGAEPVAGESNTTPAPSRAQDSGANATGAANRGASAEVARIFAYGLQSGSLTPEDTQYVGRVIAQRTGMSAADAEKKVTATFTQIQAKAKATEAAARDAAEKTRRAASLAALWMFVAMLSGAFVASFAATFGGRVRDL